MLKWTQTGLSTQLLWFPIPASASVPLLVFALHVRLWSFFLALAVCIALVVLKSKGRTAVWVYRRLQYKLGGNVMHSRPLWYRRRMQRFTGFDHINLDEVKSK
jgi:hypothetical protein